MCTHPITISHKNPANNKTQVYQVPCGKCSECLRHRQREFAALAVLEASHAGSVHFLTLTYDNRHVPIAVSDVFSDKKRKYSILDNLSASKFRTFCVNDAKSMECVVVGGKYYCPTVKREDVRLWLKRCRMAFMRMTGFYPPLYTYAAFSEYGSKTFRPHYHMCLYGCSDEFASFLDKSWQNEFGFSYLVTVPRFNKDGSDAYLKVSQYISKYISKPKTMFPWLEDGICESPRRFSSRHFGVRFLDVERLKDFYLCKDLDPRHDWLSFVERFVMRSKSITLNGQIFPLPRRLRELIYYDKTPFRSPFKQSVLYRMVMATSRVRNSEDFTRQLREYSEAHPDKSFYECLEVFLSAEVATFQARNSVAEKSILVSLQNEKV